MRSVLVRLLVLGATLFWLGFSDTGRPGTWTGYVTDTHCGTNCQRTSDMRPDRKCIDLCVKKGSKYGLWSGKHVFLLKPQDRAAKFAAEDVEVKGGLFGGAIHIESIKPVGSPSKP